MRQPAVLAAVPDLGEIGGPLALAACFLYSDDYLYAKNGDDEARTLFDGMEERDVVSWNVMIDGYVQHGRLALILFRQIMKSRLKTNEATMLAVVSACGQVGALELGQWVYPYLGYNSTSISTQVGTVLINMYGKCGSSEDAKLVFDAIKDRMLLHNNIVLGEHIVEFLLDRGLVNSGTYVLLFNIYAAARNWDGMARMRAMMKQSGVQKEPSCSSVEVNNEVHEILALVI
ncbi:hypothetical protein DH2020_025689 [Rehmannia glutinosa]|uniref:Pentatricopeptide repeat-containing protein n=1 Tax=Rehmannia glutinosa TaxID=99300 RepID=A0ABR0VZ06_REHGL